ncbi:MAG: MotA/TolQ/ExbB proton channel family protein [Rhodothermales bacterium]|nr:MotA/TolQ/ExbB proton channel family protein [Rhodothermales bacterium]
MEKSSPIGLVAGLVLIYGTIFMGDGWATFFDVGSLVLVVGGTAAALLVTFSLDDLKVGLGGVKEFFTFQAPDLKASVALFTDLSRVARREGLLALDRRLGEIDDAFIRFGMEMAVDGVEEHAIGDLMGKRIAEEAGQRGIVARFFTTAGTAAPAFGMVGTLIGLIQMLQNLTDPSQIGSGMAVALITTFYGALLANLVFLPIATKVKAQTALYVKGLEIVRAGTLGIVQGESPTMLEKRLRLLAGDADGDDEDADVPLQKAA